jgi:hypothetical protein
MTLTVPTGCPVVCSALIRKTGSLFDDADFAYLPNGPLPAIETHASLVMKSPTYTHLAGPWYSWTVSS